MKSFLTILLLCSTIFALIEEAPGINEVPESQKTNLVITTNEGQSIKVNTDQLSGLARSHGHKARKARLTSGRNRKANDESSTISFDVNEFSVEDFPTDLQSEVETLQDSIQDLDNAIDYAKVNGGQVCFGSGTAKAIKESLENYQALFVEVHQDEIEDLIEEYEEGHEDDDRKKKTARGLKTANSEKTGTTSDRKLAPKRRHRHRKH